MRRSRDRARPERTSDTTHGLPLPAATTLGAGAAQPTAAGTPRRRPTPERRVLVVGAALLGGVVAAAVLAGAMSDAMTSRAAALEARAMNAQIEARVAAGRREVEFAKTSAFLGFASRSFGYGRLREQQFALSRGAAPLPAVTPLGSDQVTAPSTDMIGSVLELLFER